ncbi:MAG TPA: TIGR03564 family F420-dependent LLM class oxidoreductase [Acidimicrobiia bacterium]|jgi:F420-dependent oxidoreductase-like protein|nr:TIGR03564 family F420-dependent LLM class oxidoreductase [Acidimicrobiia bacterium]
MKIGIFGGDTAGRTIDDVVADARVAEADGFESYTLPQIFALDAMGVLAVVGREVPRIGLMTGVVPTYGRHPLTMAQQALTVQAASGGRFTLGIGLSHQLVIEGMFGLSFEKPVRHMREYLAALIPLINEGKASAQGETISTEASLGIEPRIACPVLVAALGEQMLKLAGTVTDGTMTWMTGPATLAAHTVPTISAAAKAAGRPAPRIAASLPICVTNDVDAARERAARDFQVYGFLPSYRAMLDREGAEGPADVAIVGDEATVEKCVRALGDAGVSEFVAAEFGSREERTQTRALLKSML